MFFADIENVDHLAVHNSRTRRSATDIPSTDQIQPTRSTIIHGFIYQGNKYLALHPDLSVVRQCDCLKALLFGTQLILTACDSGHPPAEANTQVDMAAASFYKADRKDTTSFKVAWANSAALVTPHSNSFSSPPLFLAFPVRTFSNRSRQRRQKFQNFNSMDPSTGWIPICKRWNFSMCVGNCKFLHICWFCRQNHQERDCQRNRPVATPSSLPLQFVPSPQFPPAAKQQMHFKKTG